jgi:hypothetical protein
MLATTPVALPGYGGDRWTALPFAERFPRRETRIRGSNLREALRAGLGLIERRDRIGLHAVPAAECTGSVYRARYYDPTRVRFVSEDPIGLAGGSNVFTYGENNPVLFTDPSGLAELIKPTWPNGNLRPGVYRQDGECTLPGRVAGPLNKNKRTKKCCQEHDECYAKHGCNASSWGRTLLGLPSACYMCNHRVVDCLLRDLGRTECGCEK